MTDSMKFSFYFLCQNIWLEGVKLIFDRLLLVENGKCSYFPSETEIFCAEKVEGLLLE